MVRSTRLRTELIGLAAGLSLLTAAGPPSEVLRRNPNEQLARRKFAVAQKAYNVGDFEVALTAYSEAYQLKPLPGFLFNIAQCHRQLGHYERAAFFYKRYLSLATVTRAEADLVHGLIREVESMQADDDQRQREQAEAEAERRREEARVLAAKAEAEATRHRELELEANRKADLDQQQPAAAAVRAAVSPDPTPPRISGAITTKWWFWTGIGVLATGIGTTIYFATEPKARPTTLPTINGRPP